MRIKLENVGIAVRDLEAAIAFFTDLGLTVLGRDTVSGEWTDTAVGHRRQPDQYPDASDARWQRSPRALRVHPPLK